MQGLSCICTEEDIETVLKDIPADMNKLWAKIMANLSKDRRGAKLAKTTFRGLFAHIDH